MPHGAKTRATVVSGPVVVLVAKRTSWSQRVERDQDPHILDLLRRRDPTVARMEAAHQAHESCMKAVESALQEAGASWTRVTAGQAFSEQGVDLVLSVGGDGTLLAASHQVDRAPILGVNSAPGMSVGFFCGADALSIGALLPRAIGGDLPGVSLNRMEVSRNGAAISRRVLNDALMCHTCPAATSRYIFELGDLTEEQRSSGFWIGPAAGSTAAQRSAGGDILPLDSDELQLVVREPYLPRDGTLHLRRRLITPTETLRVRCKMHDGMLFLDGPAERSTLVLGDVLEFRRSSEPLRLLGLSADRQRP
ncbi:MAG: NAD(+) kinase [Myxococcales bacterium]|nr:MAG: NAD(+) kinase [Myxococcales bacterium]